MQDTCAASSRSDISGSALPRCPCRTAAKGNTHNLLPWSQFGMCGNFKPRRLNPLSVSALIRVSDAAPSISSGT